MVLAMNIEIESTMRTAARDGISEYLPTFRGKHLDVESCFPEASLKNLKIILSAGVKLVWAEVVENGGVYLAFDSGQTYLALGFAVGGIEVGGKRRLDARIIAFAEFLSQAVGLTTDDWCKKLTDEAYSSDFRGDINLEIAGPDVENIATPRLFEEI